MTPVKLSQSRFCGVCNKRTESFNGACLACIEASVRMMRAALGRANDPR